MKQQTEIEDVLKDLTEYMDNISLEERLVHKGLLTQRGSLPDRKEIALTQRETLDWVLKDNLAE